MSYLRLKPNEPTETEILYVVLHALRLHKKVSFAMRVNSGAAKIDGRFIKFNTGEGTSDIIGMLKNGRFLAIETKRFGEKPTLKQQAFIDMINDGGGLAGVAHGIDDAFKLLEGA